MNRTFGIDIELSDQQKLFGISRAEYPDPISGQTESYHINCKNVHKQI